MNEISLHEGISILISTYNGAEKLPSTLKAISELDVSGIPEVQLILVDNNSSDQTSKIAERLWISLGNPFAFTLVQEPRPGKLNAQETGLTLVNHEYVLICDDDNELFPDYLQVGYKYLSEKKNIGILGGQGIAKSTVDIPKWFDDYSYFFACAPQAPQTGEVRLTRNVVYGAGMWIRMEGYRMAKAKGFEFLLASRTSKSLSTGGEDSELCWALRFLGYEVWYIDQMKFHHHVPNDRLTEKYRNKLRKGMFSNGPIGGIYLRIAKGEITNSVRMFWVKELVYTMLYLIKLPLDTRIVNKRLEFYRVFNNIRHFIRLRSQYDEKINRLLEYKLRCLDSHSSL